MRLPAAVSSRRSLRDRLQEAGVVEFGRGYLADRYDELVRRVAHRHAAPRVSEMFNRAQLQSTDVRSLIAQLPGFPLDRWDAIVREFAETADALRQRYSAPLAYPTISAFSTTESQLVFALVRGFGPQQVVETGVANGHSSYVVLDALRRNGRGRLLSVDVRPDVGALVPDALRANWDLRILSRRRLRQEFEATFRDLSSIDLFIHDSDHAYRWQAGEFRLAWPRLTTGGLLASDDADWSYAFLDFSTQVARRPAFLITDRKAFGLLPRREWPAGEGPVGGPRPPDR